MQMIGTTRKMSDETMIGFGFVKQDYWRGGTYGWHNSELGITFHRNPTYKAFLVEVRIEACEACRIETRDTIKQALGL